MYRIYTIFLLLLSINISGYCQKQPQYNKQRWEDIETQKIAFISRFLELTPKEAQAFWPLYNELQAKKDSLGRHRRMCMRKAKMDMEGMPEAQISKVSDKIIELQLKTAILQKEYHSKLKKILPPIKVLRLYHAERQFQNILLRQIKEHGRHRYRGNQK